MGRKKKPALSSKDPRDYTCWTNSSSTGYRDAVNPQTWLEETTALAKWQSYCNSEELKRRQLGKRTLRTTVVTKRTTYQNNLPTLEDLFMCHPMPWVYDEEHDVVWDSIGTSVVSRLGKPLSTYIVEGQRELRRRAEVVDGLKFVTRKR